ncbi:MAG TPA: MFS transporter [Spirochaetia bacterium]|nr:MFS transporter [Spirochaetia bacterium]
MENKSEELVTRRTALIVATLAAFITPFMSSSINIALPSMGQEFSMDAVSLGWVATAFLLAAAMFLVPMGKIADIHGRKKIFLWGLGVYTVSSLACALSRSAGWLIAFRVLQGISAAMIFGTGIAILTSVYPAGERGKVLGINVASTYSGLSLGPVLGGLLTQHLGWRIIFLVNVPIGLAAFALVIWRLKGEWAEARGEKFDLPGSVIFGVSLAAVMYGLTRLPAWDGAWFAGGGCAGVAVFVLWETRVKSPVLNLHLFAKNRVFALSNVAALINYSATAAVAFLLSLYLQYIKGFSPQNAGLILVCQPVMMAVFSPFAGRLSDRIEPRIIASIGMAMTMAGLALLALLGRDTQPAFIVLSLVVLGSGFALFSSPNTNTVMSSVERKYYGIASATLGTMRLTGQMLSMGIAMLIFALFIGRVQITPAYYGRFLTSFRTAFGIFACLCFLGVFASVARGKIHSR